MSDHEPGRETPDKPSVIRKLQVPGTLIGYWTDSLKAHIELDDGRTIEAPAARQLEGRFTIGDAVLVYFDAKDDVIGWLLPDVNAGVNLRHSEES